MTKKTNKKENGEKLNNEEKLNPPQYFCGEALTEDYCKELVLEVKEDFKQRAENRRNFELSWQLNMNFLAGKQHTEISPLHCIEEAEKQFLWQSREVFNHIAPIIETRCAKLSRVRPKMSVRAFGEEESDIYAAKMSSKILNNCYNGLDLNKTIANATMWSEVCGTVFYKIVWDDKKGNEVGKNGDNTISDGDISVSVCPPFEIFPENIFAEEIENQKSIIHAKAMHIQTIEELWGIKAEGEDIDIFTLDRDSIKSDFNSERQKFKDYAMVIEKYELPSKKYKEGRLIITAGDKLMHISCLPYINLGGKKRGYPFIKQCSMSVSGSFFGISVIERCIPVQRAYNAVKNRKHEFINRLASGVLAVEDGSTDTDLLEEEGLAPGRVIIYRQGSNPPQLMNPGSVPVDFTYEEERLLSEFKLISGVSDVMRNSSTPSSLTSGVALSLLVEQDDTRLSVTAELIRNSVKQIGQQILRLYKQYASSPRLLSIAGENNSIEHYYFDSKNISSDDIVFDTENELSQSPAQKKSMILDMLKNGLLTDSSGKLSQRMKTRIADLLGFSGFENGLDLVNLNIKRAAKENLELIKSFLEPLEIDDHELHIAEHIKYMLSGEFETAKGNKKTENFLQHIRGHKTLISLNTENKEAKENGGE